MAAAATEAATEAAAAAAAAAAAVAADGSVQAAPDRSLSKDDNIGHESDDSNEHSDVPARSSTPSDRASTMRRRVVHQ